MKHRIKVIKDSPGLQQCYLVEELTWYFPVWGVRALCQTLDDAMNLIQERNDGKSGEQCLQKTEIKT